MRFIFNTCPPSRRRHSQAGMTLIEVLVALLIFSFGLLGLAGLQARALQFSTSAEDTNRAALLANQMAFMITDKQNVDPQGTSSGPYADWVAQVASPASGGMPSGVGAVQPDVAASSATITITWRSVNATAAEPMNRYMTQVVLP